MLGKTMVDDDTPTACTNGRDTWYGREFADKLSDKERRGVILHENLHKAFRHRDCVATLVQGLATNGEHRMRLCDQHLNT
jgi:hypothetical protein